MDYCAEYLVSFVSFLRELKKEHNIARGGGGGYTESLADSPILVYVQTLHNDCLHIEDVHLLFCTHFMIFYVQRFSESRSSSGSTLSVHLTATISGCLVCVICNSNINSNFAL